MYELVCKSAQERKEWIENLRKAVNESPEEGKLVTLYTVRSIQLKDS